MKTRFLGGAVLFATTCLGLAGCAKSNSSVDTRSEPAAVDPDTRSDVSLVEQDAPYKDIDVKQPDFIIVTKVAVTPEQARSMATLRTQPASEHVPTADEQRIGDAFASALQTELVRAITNAGVQAHPEGSGPRGSFKDGVVLGYCLQGTAGSSAGTVGFQLKDDHFRVRVIFNIREVPVNGVTVDVATRLRAGMSDDKVRTIAAEEATMVADRLVQELLVPAYKRRGWELR